MSRQQRRIIVKTRKTTDRWISQGDIIRNVEHIEGVKEEGGQITVTLVTFPLVVVLTQECDLIGDYRVRWGKEKPGNQDKQLLSVLVAPLYNAEHFWLGTHLEELQLTMEAVVKRRQDRYRNNDVPRYHYLEFPKTTRIVDSVIDFKHYFSVDVTTLRACKSSGFVCRLGDLFRESVSLRFANFLSRIGLPETKVGGDSPAIAAAQGGVKTP
jgi:hypothetical protein